MKRSEVIEKITESIRLKCNDLELSPIRYGVYMIIAEAALKACEDADMKPPYRKADGIVGAGYAWEPEE